MAIRLTDILSEAGRIPRKKGQRRNSKKHSDLYTDENPKGTIHGLKFATVKDAEASINKIKSSGRKHAHKVQAAVAMEQRAKAAGKKSAAAVYRKYINSVKKSEGIVSEAISKNNVQSIVDRILPQIIDNKGTGKQGIPKIKLHTDIYARYSGIDGMTGEESESSKAEWVHQDNTIYIYYPNMMNEEDVIKSVLHEFEHSLQDPKQNDKYRAKGYDKNPNEMAARKAELDWKDYMKRPLGIKEGKVLSVFDFDDTIAKSDAWVYVMRGNRIVKKLDPAEFAVYKPRPGEQFDFREFDRKIRNPRLIKRNADLLVKQLDKARRSSKGSRKVTILTARRLGQPVTSFLKTMGIDAYVVPLGSADPKKKADWIEKQINKGYDTIYFMDDSPKNISAVDSMLKRYPNVKSITKLIKEVDYQARLSRGHQPDYYQLGTSEFKPFDKSRDDIEENITQNLIDAWKKETSDSEIKMFCKRDGCGPAALDLMSFAEERGIELKRIEGFFHADKVASEKKDFTPEMKDEFLDQGGNFNNAKEREEWVENSKYSDQWKFIPHYWLEDDKGNIYDPVGQEQFIDMGFAKDLNKERYTLTDEVNENFADGKKPGRKGISKRVGIPKGATLTQLAKLAKAKGEKGRMARWQLNMRRGKKKKKS